jgi:hypothetical protein
MVRLISKAVGRIMRSGLLFSDCCGRLPRPAVHICRVPANEAYLNVSKQEPRSMPDNTQSDVLQSDKHSTMSAEEIAKAVARHKKNHSADKSANQELKAKKPKK